MIPRGAGSNLCCRHRRRARRDRHGADPDGQDPGGQRGRAARARRDRRQHRGAGRRGGRQGPALRAGPGQPHRLDRGWQRRHVRGRAARAQVRRHPQLRAGRDGRPAHRRDHEDRWAAVEGRGGLRPHPPAHRVGGHPRGPHGADRRAAAHARHQQHRSRLLPDAGRRGPGRRRDHRPRDRPGDAGVPRRQVHRRRRAVRPPGAARRRGRAAAVRRRRRTGRRRPQPRPDRRAVHGDRGARA